MTANVTAADWRNAANQWDAYADTVDHPGERQAALDAAVRCRAKAEQAEIEQHAGRP